LLHDSYQNFPHIGVACVHPGHVGTDIALLAEHPETIDEAEIRKIAKLQGYEGAETSAVHDLIERFGESFKKSAPLTAAHAASIILNGIKNGKTRILVGEDAFVLDLLSRLFPRLIYNDFFMTFVLGPWALSASRVSKYLGMGVGRFAYPIVVLSALRYATKLFKSSVSKL
jgi:hypothetical protein